MELIIAILGTYGLTTVLVYSEGPFSVFDRIRNLRWLTAFECFLCMSVWIAFFVSVVFSDNITQLTLYTAASCGGAILLHNLTNKEY